MAITKNLHKVLETIPKHVTLVAVSKTKPKEAVMEAYNAGQLVFGENKVQEMAAKWEELPKDIYWHMIGHLQRNKVKYMAKFVSLVHGVDSFRLLEEINKRAALEKRTINCLLQVHIAKEDTKFGLNIAELEQIITSPDLGPLKNINIKGLMGMATFTEDRSQIRREFKQLRNVFEDLKCQLPQVDTLSMGMSGDYKIAIEEGSTMVRIGSSIFGARNY